jgi:Protease inhibitor Inh
MSLQISMRKSERRVRLLAATGPTAAALLFALIALSACSGSTLLGAGQPEQASAPTDEAAPPLSPPPSQPPINLAGAWKLSAAGGAGCVVNFGMTPGAAQGTIAPEGGCPGKFFTSRKWTYDNGALIVHDFKGRRLAQLALSGDHFQGQDNDGTALTLSR